MNQNNNQIYHTMKLKHLFLAFVAGATSLVSCELLEQFGLNEEDLGLAELTVDLTELTLPKEESTATLTLVATRDWIVSGDLPEWITLSATSGEASTKPQSITVTVLENKGNDRETTIAFTIGTKKASVIVKQAGEKGEYVVPTVSCADFIKTDGQTEYIISGKVTSMNATYQYAYINDGTAEVEVYKPSNWADFADKIKVGATLKAQGVYTLYTDKNGKNIHELVGVILEVKEKEPQTNVTTVTCAEFIQTDGITEYIISGKVTSMNANYKYAYINDGTAEVEVYQPTNWDEYASKIKEGVTLKAQGVYAKYTNNNTGKTIDELVGVILSVEGEGNPPAEATQADPAGDGSQANPFNVSAAINKAKETGETVTEIEYYIKGKVSAVKDGFGNNTYGNGTYELIDEGYTAVFTAYRILYFGGEKWAEGDATIAVGDEIVVIGKIVNFKNNTPETNQGGYLYSLNGQTSVAQSAVFDVEKTEIKVSASATSAEIKVKGNVAWSVSRKSDQVTCTPTSGEGAGTITVTFAANESTENEVSYSVGISTEADVANKLIVVNITQAKVAVAGETSTITIPLTNATTFAEDNGGDTLKSGFAATVEGFKVATYKYKSTNNPVTPDGYSMRVYKNAVFFIEAPSGKTITALCFKANNYDNGKYILDMTGVEGTEGTAVADKASEVIKWEGEASTVILQAAAGQTRLESVDVYYK